MGVISPLSLNIKASQGSFNDLMDSIYIHADNLSLGKREQIFTMRFAENVLSKLTNVYIHNHALAVMLLEGNVLHILLLIRVSNTFVPTSSCC